MFCDEAFWAGDRAGIGPLKRLITEPTLVIERKGIDQVHEANSVKLFLATNNEWAAPVELQDRRFFVLDVSEAQRQKLEYFGRIEREMATGGREALLAFLLARKIDRDIRQIPKTAAWREQQDLSLAPELRWWKECLRLGSIGDQDWRNWISTDDLVWAYLHFCDRMDLNRQRATSLELIKRIGPFLPGSATAKKGMALPRDEQTGRVIVGAPKMQKRGWILPSLADCRSQFDTRSGSPTDWPNEEVDDVEASSTVPTAESIPF